MSYLGHLRWYRTFRDAHSLQLGGSTYYHPAADEIPSVNAHAFDILYRWKPLRQGEWKSFLLGGEVMFVPEAGPEAADLDVLTRDPIGLSFFTQWQFDRRTYAGVRYDNTDTLRGGLRRTSVTPYLSYYFSEFLRFRVNYEHRWSDLEEEDARNSAFLELNWVFGSHPPEPFWVNK
jgi:hypothetical protein